MIEGEPIGHPRAAVVPDDVEAIVPQGGHDLDHVQRHRALGVREMLFVRVGLAARAVAAKIGRDNREALSDSRRDFVPDDVSLRIAVNHQQWRPAATGHDRYLSPGGLDGFGIEAFEHTKAI